MKILRFLADNIFQALNNAPTTPSAVNPFATVADLGGGGKIGISDALGEYTFYDTIALANAAASAGDTIKFFTNITETGAVEWILKDGVIYDLNGYTYTLNVATTENAVTDNNVAAKCTILNGTIKRTGGVASTGDSLGLHVDNVGSKIYLEGVQVVNTFGMATRTEGTTIGGRHIGYTIGTAIGWIGIVGGELHDAYCYGETSHGLQCYGKLTNTISESDGGYGGQVATNNGIGIADNCSFYSSVSYGLQINGAKLSNCVARSDGNHGAYCNTGVNEIQNCSFYSTAGYGWVNSSSVYVRMYNCTAFSSANYGFYFQSSTEQTIKGCVGLSTVNAGIAFTDVGNDEAIIDCHAHSTASTAMLAYSGRVKNCSAVCDWDNIAGHGISGYTVSIAAEISGCTIEVTNASANCIYNPNAKSSYIANNVYGANATTPVHANVTNLQTIAADAYGNIQIG